MRIIFEKYVLTIRVFFFDFQTKQNLTIPIIDDMNPEKDEYFEVVLYDPTNGAKIGNINRVLVTISNDDGN